MKKNKELIEKLKEDLAELEAFNKNAWMSYGDELCAGEMFRKEDELRERINELEGKSDD